MEDKRTPEEFEAFENPIEPSQTMISADFTDSETRGRKEILKYLKGDKADFIRGPEEKENIGEGRQEQGNVEKGLTAFIDSGGEGIDLAFEEICMVYGIAYIFTKYDYPPYIVCKEKELYETLGYAGKFGGWQRRDLRKALENLSKKNLPLYWKEHNCRWLTYDSLIKLAWGVWDDGEFQEIPSRENFELYRIELNKRLFGRIEENFRLVNPDIGREIREYRRKHNKRATKYDIRLYGFLIHKNETPIKRNYLKLASGPMLMDGLIRQKGKRWIRDRLNNIYEMYCHLGYLTGFKLDQAGTRYKIDVLHLNHEKFYGLRGVKK